MDGAKEKSIQNYLSFTQVLFLIESIRDIRDRLVIKILYETGCSIGELVRIKAKDIWGSHIKIINPDTKEQRNSCISQKLGEELDRFIKGNDLQKDSCIISTKNNEGISEKRVRQIIQHCTKEAGYGKLNPQRFRYYHIAHAYLSGVFIDNISAQLGIKKLRIFQILSELGIEQTKDTYNNFFETLEGKNEKEI